MRIGIRRLGSSTALLLAVLPLCLAVKAYCASFDCEEARTEAEKLICANVELSKLDEEMGKTYSDALKKFSVPAALKLRQKQWLKRRDACVNGGLPKYISQCVKENYKQRLAELTSLMQADLPCPELPIIKREKEKAQCLKHWLAKHPLELREEHTSKKDQQFCTDFYQALATASPEISYVEPVLRTEDPQHPGIKRYRQCHDYQPIGLGYDYQGLDAQAHGFRLYRVDLDGNPKKGLKEYLYEEESGANRLSHYLRVSFGTDRCDIQDTVGATSEEARRSSSAGDGLNSMISYRDNFYIIDLNGYLLMRAIGYNYNHQKFSSYQCNWFIPKRLLNDRNN